MKRIRTEETRVHFRTTSYRSQSFVRNYSESNGKIRSCKIRYCKEEDSLVYGVQQEKSQNGKRKGILHRNMLLPCEAILEESEGFHLKKELQMKIK